MAPPLWILVVAAALAAAARAEYSIDDSALFKVSFGALEDKLKEKAAEEVAEASEPEPASGLRRVRMRTANNEEYWCSLPRLESASEEASEPYDGKSALEILGQLFATQSCAYRLEHYWTYEGRTDRRTKFSKGLFAVKSS